MHVYAIDSVVHLNIVVQSFKYYVYIPTIESSSMKNLVSKSNMDQCD